MRKFVSLSAAMMMGAVIGKKENAIPALERAKVLLNEAKLAEIAKTVHLERPVKIPGNRRDSINVYMDRESNDSVSISKESLSREKPHYDNRRRRGSPVSPKVQ